MAQTNTHRITAPAPSYTDDQLLDIIMRSEKEDRWIDRPHNNEVAKQLRRVTHKIIAARLISARNRSGLNNEKINVKMHNLYIERRRAGKNWAFTNLTSQKMSYLPDAEEIDMLCQILPIDPNALSVHIKVLPWALKEQADQAKSRRKKDVGTSVMPESKSSPVKKDASQYIAKEDDDYSSSGELKISHKGSDMIVTGGVWCDKAVVQKLRMIVPLKLVKQGLGNDKSFYEIKGPVHAYQLYNLMHILYGAPRVLDVDLSS